MQTNITCSKRAAATLSMPCAYRLRAFPSPSACGVGAAICSTAAALVAARPNACGSVLCTGAGGGAGAAGAGSFVPFKFAAAKEVILCPSEVESSASDS
jgi:hypothetical protein